LIEQKLRNKIGIDVFNSQLQKARDEKDAAKVAELELVATKTIAKVLREYPYQDTQEAF
jgi:hypothetical protein